MLSVPAHSEREGVAYALPVWLEGLVANRTAPPLVRVRRIERDYGPATKLIPSVMEAQAPVGEGGLGGENVLVLVVDDDTLYPPRLLETLLEWQRRLPTAALAFSGWPVVAKTLHYPHWSENYLVYGNELFAPHPVSVIRGNCGYLVQTAFFGPGLWEGFADAPPGAFFMDDVWISGRLASSGVRRFVVPFDEDQFTMTPNLENVTTLDHVTLDKPPALAKALKLEAEERAAGTAAKPGRLTAAAAAAEKEKAKPPPKEQGSNRVLANEQALLHFKRAWDVLWDNEHYKVMPGAGAVAGTSGGKQGGKGKQALPVGRPGAATRTVDAAGRPSWFGGA